MRQHLLVTALGPTLLTRQAAKLKELQRMDENLELNEKFAWLDSLELPFVCFDSSLCPVFLSTQAAKILAIRNRSSLASEPEILEPLASLARSQATTVRRGILLKETRPLVEELALQTKDEATIPAVAHVRLVPSPGTAHELHYLVVFHDITYLSPLLEILEQSKRNRALLILASSMLRKNLAFQGTESNLLRSHEVIEKEFFRNQLDPRPFHTELLSALTEALEIIHPLVIPSVRISVEAKTSALLKIGEPDFIRIVAHLVLEATDFVGPFGQVKLKTRLRRGDKGQPATALVAVLAQRASDLPAAISPIELYLYRRFMPVHYKVATRDELGIEQKDTSDQSRLSVYGSSSFLVAQETFSENLQIASHIARACSVTVELKRPSSNLLVLNSRFELEAEKLTS